MGRNYGVSYKGSKSRIVEKLVMAIPYVGVDNFYDLFAGGCAVTHKMLLDGRFKHYFANDVDGQALRLFYDGMKGRYADEKRWISREDFYNLKASDAYISCCWSFGNNQRDYLYSKAIEPYKKACHYAIVFGDYSLLKELYPDVGAVCEVALDGITDIHERRIKFRSVIGCKLAERSDGELLRLSQTNDVDRLESLERLERLQSLESLESLERLERLQSLERLERLQRFESFEYSVSDYKDVEIKPNSIIYADIPYFSTNTYNKKSSTLQSFDHAEFYDWCCGQKELVLVSEYTMPVDRFTEVWSTRHIQRICATKTSATTERLFVPTRQLSKYNEMMNRTKELRVNKRSCVELSLFNDCQMMAMNG